MRGGVWRDHLTPTNVKQAVNVIRLFGLGYVFRTEVNGQPWIIVTEVDGEHGEFRGLFSGRTPHKELLRLLQNELA